MSIQRQLSFLFDINIFRVILSIQRFFNLTKYWKAWSQTFTTHYACRNADLSLIQVAAINSGLIFQTTD